MRHQVPFVGERKVVRAEDEQARAKRLSGKVIDDVVGEGVAPSSWDDLVPEGWVDRSVPKVSKPAVSASVARSSAAPQTPARTGSTAKPKPATAKPAVKKTSAGASAITFSDSASLDWIPINNGRGLRVNIHGCIDNDLRKEWARLLEGTADAGVEEFEFNLSDTPALSLTGLGMLLLFKERKRSAREAISLCNCNKDVAQLLEWTGMDRYFVIKTTQITEPS
ncbi:STAS domain-containing protein [Cellvibrio sp. QJXJ]|uniref:STAS domain-containing protein n=1 Tax=Cellvibrio sp. QJXJ TaxID=2964606 RepID=UPI0021C2C4A5|nr:STAS domain-containing protein [Cellvibrio sp. QJXJ]UUA72586.1 STAS domain-containing protein [Cellvibrio sp. QJXJ]